MKKLLVILFLLIPFGFFACNSNSDPKPVKESVYKNVNMDSFLGTWEYFIEKTDKQPYMIIYITKENNSYFFRSEIIRAGSYFEDVPKHEVLEFIGYNPNNYLLPNPYIKITGWANRIEDVLIFLENTNHLQYRGDKYYKK